MLGRFLWNKNHETPGEMYHLLAYQPLVSLQKGLIKPWKIHGKGRKKRVVAFSNICWNFHQTKHWVSISMIQFDDFFFKWVARIHQLVICWPIDMWDFFWISKKMILSVERFKEPFFTRLQLCNVRFAEQKRHQKQQSKSFPPSRHSKKAKKYQHF